MPVQIINPPYSLYQLLFPSGAAGITLYNTTDQTTNYEKSQLYWTSNNFYLQTSAAGTGTVRDLYLFSGASTYLKISQTTSPFFKFDRSTGVAASSIVGINTTYSNSSGDINALKITSTINQTGTAASRDFVISRTETANGSGEQKSIVVEVNGTEYFFVARTQVNGCVGQMIYLRQLATAPTSSNANGGFIYIEGGALKYRGIAGTVTTIAPS